MKKLTIILIVVLLFTLTACGGGEEPQGGLPPWFDVDNVRLYSLDPNTFEFDYIEVHSSRIIDKMLEINGIPIDDFWFETIIGFDGERPPINIMVVNLNAEAEWTSLQGSTGAWITAEVLLSTFGSFPNIHQIEFLIDGERGRFGSHFDFTERFMVNRQETADVVNVVDVSFADIDEENYFIVRLT